MACFSLEWLKDLLIWLVIVLVVIGIVKLLIPALMSWFGAPPGGGSVMTILGYILWGIVAIAVIIFVFDLITCALGNGGTGLSFPRAR